MSKVTSVDLLTKTRRSIVVNKVNSTHIGPKTNETEKLDDGVAKTLTYRSGWDEYERCD